MAETGAFIVEVNLIVISLDVKFSIGYIDWVFLPVLIEFETVWLRGSFFIFSYVYSVF